MAALAGVVGGIARVGGGAHSVADGFWAATTALLLVPLTISVVRSLLRRDVGVDAIALVSMAGALALGEYLAGAVVALMLAGGNALEERANRRAARELTALVERAPRTALMRRGEQLVEVPVEVVVPGDRVVVRAGEVVPVDGMVESEEAVVDESALTGEPLPVTIGRGGQVRSGTSCAGSAFELSALRPAAESTYAALVRLVEQAGSQRAPFVRIADRYAAIFLPVTAVVAGLAWAVSGDPVRALAVFVVATPCPLILAAPIALQLGALALRASRRRRQGRGDDRAARQGALGAARQDGHGDARPARARPRRAAERDPRRRNAAARRERRSPLVASAGEGTRRRRRSRRARTRGTERRGGVVRPWNRGRRGRAPCPRREPSLACAITESRRRSPPSIGGEAKVLIAVDGAAAGVALIGDQLRSDADRLVPRLREAGIRHIAIVTGDRRAVAEAVGERLGVDRVYAEQTPDQKLDVVRALQAQPELHSIVMVGDGINDAPALALADVGIAMGSGGATVSSETADAVVLVDRVDRVADAISFSRRALYIAQQSVLLGHRRVADRDGLRGVRLPPAGRRRAPPGSDRRRRDPERPARVEGVREVPAPVRTVGETSRLRSCPVGRCRGTGAGAALRRVAGGGRHCARHGSGAGSRRRGLPATRFSMAERARARRRPPYLRLALNQLLDPLVLLLIAAAGVSIAIGDVTEGVAIAAILVLNGILGFWQEAGAERAILALSEAFTRTALVIRDGVTREVPGEDVVPGDLLVLRAGDRVAADGRVVETSGLEIDESALDRRVAPGREARRRGRDGCAACRALHDGLRGHRGDPGCGAGARLRDRRPQRDGIDRGARRSREGADNAAHQAPRAARPPDGRPRRRDHGRAAAA